jgi:signal transduction histidine kinase
MERVRAQAAELAVLLDDLIDAARQAADSQPLEVAPIGLGDLIVVAAEEGRVLAEPREVAILAESPAGGPVINADFRQLKQAVMIGIDNAVKHSPPGGTIRVFAVSEGTAAAIRITDEGTGIADEDLPHLFERFYRGRDEGALLNTGFGIGLAIAKGIVERHDGTISLRNGETGGALFEILLPLGRTG